MTVEPPRGIKANLLKAYMNQVPDFLDYFNSTDSKVPNFKVCFLSFNLVKKTRRRHIHDVN